MRMGSSTWSIPPKIPSDKGFKCGILIVRGLYITMEFGNQINQRRGDARLSLFQNSGYQTERETKKTLLVDISGDETTIKDFSVNLMEPLIIDRLSDVYLDSFTTWNVKVNNDATTPQNTGFTLRINEFPISTNVASNQNTTATKYDSTKYGAIFIANSSSVAEQAVTHKAKKFNYVCTINPGKITTISGSILDAGTRADPPLYATPFAAGECRFIAEFVIVSRD